MWFARQHLRARVDPIERHRRRIIPPELGALGQTRLLRLLGSVWFGESCTTCTNSCLLLFIVLHVSSLHAVLCSLRLSVSVSVSRCPLALIESRVPVVPSYPSVDFILRLPVSPFNSDDIADIANLKGIGRRISPVIHRERSFCHRASHRLAGYTKIQVKAFDCRHVPGSIELNIFFAMTRQFHVSQ